MGSTNEDAQIPVIDISPRNPEGPRQLLDAASRYGFVFVENNDAGIPPKDIAQMFDLSKHFFAAPVEEKESVSIKSNSVGKNHGWLSRGVEKLDPRTQKRADVKEAFNIGEPLNNTFQQPLPATLKPHASTILSFQHACHALCQRINTALALALQIDKAWFTSRHGSANEGSSSVFRLLYYPQALDYEDGVDIRAGAHSDYGSITLLFQQRGQPGLEIRTPAGEWAAVPVDPHETAGAAEATGKKPLPILVNIGDLLEDWTGGLLKSTVHRVIFPSAAAGDQSGARADRYSMAYFCHPLDQAELVPVPSKLVEEFAAKNGRIVSGREKDGKVLTAADHLKERLAATYKIG